MKRIALASGLACAAFSSVLWVATPEASASPCERRTASHLAEHGGRMADDAYHVARGEMPACDDASDRSGSDHNDGGGNDSDDGGFNRHRDRIKPSWRDLF